MGWANCGEDKRGRPIGYAHQATCDYPGCDELIDRGLGYACGEYHGAETNPPTNAEICDKYFCSNHRSIVEAITEGEGCELRLVEVCLDCYAKAPTCRVCGFRSWALSDGYCHDCAEALK
jgi:hypothetical protein